MSNCFVAPSILSADFAFLGSAVKEIQQAGADLIHMDVMDGIFVPNITFGPKMIADLRSYTTLPFDVHLMITKPENYLSDFAIAGANTIIFHSEAVVHTHRIIQMIQDLGKNPGISIVPSTSVVAIEEILPFVNQVLIMMVNPGFGGQELLPFCLEKVRKLVQIRKEKQLSFKIAADGGINETTAAQVREAGVDILITGSAFFSSKSKSQFIKCLRGM